VRHDCWIEDGSLLRDAAVLKDIPVVVITGRFDFQAPPGNAWELKRAWPGAELVIVDNAGHSGAHEAITQEIVRATDRFARKSGDY
jgi:proline iminopeptidase